MKIYLPAISILMGCFSLSAQNPALNNDKKSAHPDAIKKSILFAQKQSLGFLKNEYKQSLELHIANPSEHYTLKETLLIIKLTEPNLTREEYEYILREMRERLNEYERFFAQLKPFFEDSVALESASHSQASLDSKSKEQYAALQEVIQSLKRVEALCNSRIATVASDALSE